MCLQLAGDVREYCLRAGAVTAGLLARDCWHGTADAGLLARGLYRGVLHLGGRGLLVLDR